MNDGLSPEQREGIRRILESEPKVVRAVLFGSRALGTFKRASDVDLALEGESITLNDLLGLMVKISNLNLPVEVDFAIRSKISNPALEEHIRTYGQEWWKRNDVQEVPS